MWTPKRILILLGGLALVLTGYLVYAYFLGGIDGLPVLNADYLPTGDHTEIEIGPIEDGETERKMKRAFGPEGEELKRPIKLDLRSKGVTLAASQFDIEPDGRVKLSPFSAALFPKSKGESTYPEINIVTCEMAYLTLDQPVTNLAELSNRKIVGVELRGNRGVTLINNRRSAEKNDDIELLITNAPLFYEEQKNLIWTDGYVQLLDMKTQPEPTKITAKGMALKLADDTSPNRSKGGPRAKGKEEAVNGVKLLHLKSHVEMHLFVDANSGFLAGPGDVKGKSSTRKEPAEKSHVIVKTSGPFHYDLPKELAWFDSPAAGGGVPASPDQVLVSREHKVGGSKKYDQLLCDHLELQFRKKSDTDPKATRDTESADKEIATALATIRSKELVLTMDTENLEAYGTELHYRSPTASAGPQTILKGAPSMRAVKDGHKIEARELHLIGADKNGLGQQAFAKGPGQIDIYDKSNPNNTFPTHAIWQDSLITMKERDGDKVLDVLTMTGNASFVDEEHKQALHGQRLQVWLEADTGPTDPAKKLNATSTSRQKPYKIEAFEKVTARSPEMIVHHANHLSIRFKNEPGVGATLPDVLPPVPPPTAPGAKPAGPALSEATGSAAKPKEGKKNRKPIELWANDVVAYVTTQGDKKELQELVTEGAVHVYQEGEGPKDKGVDITGEMLNVVHHPRGDTLYVFGDSRKQARLQLGELIVFGPKVTINQKENIAEVEGAGAMNMPSKTTFDGGKPVKGSSRLTIHWNKDMLFNGKYADFHGGVQAHQDNATLRCQDLYVTLDRIVSFKEGQKENQDAHVEKLVCDLKVWVEDEKKDPAGRRIQFDRLTATQLTMDNQEGPIIAIGNGKVEHLALGGADDNLQGPAGRPKAQDAAAKVMKLTRILFEGRMFSNNKDNSRNAKFYNNVEVFHFPAEEPDARMNPDSPPKDGFYMRCNILSVFRRQLDNKTSQMMKAEGNVFFRTIDFFGNAAVVKYDESQEQVIFEGTPGNPATLYRKQPNRAEPQEIKGSKILYNRKTGVFQLEGGKVITGWRLDDINSADGPVSAGLHARARMDRHHSEIEMTRDNGGSLPRPHEHEYTLDELLAHITPDNIHSETDWGSAVGSEAW